MKVILAMVMSVDGKTTKWGEPKIYDWTSKEDQVHFSTLVEKSRVIIMGRKTYESAKSIMKLSPKQLRIVLTKTPSRYHDQTVPGQLEFTDETPRTLIKNLTARGYEEVLLTGGENTNTSFFEEKLIDELWLTIEPKIFGLGNNVVGAGKLEVLLLLKSIEKLNEQGTLLLKYEIK